MVGNLHRFEFFINNQPGRGESAYQGNAFRLEGSQDGVEFETLWTIDSSVHAGWNSYAFPKSSKPSYNIYRFYGTSQDACRVGEIKLIGIVFINDNQSYFECEPVLVLDGVSTALNFFTVDAAATPRLTSISKSYGSVNGGETVEFVGIGFSGTAKTTVELDGVPCVVDPDLQSESMIVCTTGKKENFDDSSTTLKIYIEGFGNADTSQLVFRYVKLWSDSATWN